MADSSVPVQPASPAPTVAPVGIRTVSVFDATGALVQIQAVALADPIGRLYQPLTEETGQAILAAIRALHQAFVDVNGGTPPTQ